MDLVDSMSASVPVSPAKRPPRMRRAEGASATQTLEIQPLPRWARPQGGNQEATVFCAGAGLALFDQILRGGPDGTEPVFAGCLRQRLALRAAESCASLFRLHEDAAALRDAEHLTMGGEISPAGRLHRLFRLFAAHPTGLDAASLTRALSLLGPSASVDVASGAKILQTCVAEAPDPLAAAARASALAIKLCATAAAVDAESIALWVGDLALAARLNWARPVPLLAVVIQHPSLRRGAVERARRPRPTDDDWAQSVARAYGLAIVDAHARTVDLARRAQKLLSVAPVLRAKGARRVVDLLLEDDGVTPSAAARRADLSDRAARRLFDRLVNLGVVRELSGRDSFRIYGL